MELTTASQRILADLLASRTGQYLGPGRMWRIPGALAEIFRERDIENIDQLVCLLAVPHEDGLAREVVEALLNNETYFFRDRPMFDQLAECILPKLAEARRAQRSLRIWSAGCSTGQELYSIAMLIRSQAARFDDWCITLLGTDISQRVVDSARRGEFSQFEVQRGLEVAQMIANFEDCGGRWRVRADLRRMVRFRQHNLLSPPPEEGPFDLILCRNVLLYFDPSTRSHVFDQLRRSLAADGMLMLGAGETSIGQTRAFHPDPRWTGIYHPAPPMAAARAAS